MSWKEKFGAGMDAVATHRAFPVVFWSVVVLVIGTILYGISQTQLLTSAEYQFLDLRLKMRSKNLAPSEDIVMVSLDRRTLIASRSDPSLGISDLHLSRRSIGDILAYLHKEGAKAVILDYIYSDETADDPYFASVIKKMGNVYASFHLEQNLSTTRRDFLQNMQLMAPVNSNVNEYADRFLLYQHYILPSIEYQSRVAHQFLGRRAMLPLHFGLDGMVEAFPPEWTVQRVIDIWDFRYLTRPISSSPIYLPPTLPLTASRDPLFEELVDLCKIRARQEYQHNLQFLDFMVTKKLDVEMPPVLDQETVSEIIRCSPTPLSRPIISALKGVGIPAVKEESNGYIRSVPAIYQVYGDSNFTYLGIRPAIDLMKIKHVSFKPGTLMLDNKRISLLGPSALIINWRNPALLVQKKHNKYAPESRLTLNDLKSIENSGGNLMLNGGFMYHTIPMVAVLRKAHHQPLGDSAADYFNIPGQPESKEFSFKDKIVIIGNTVHDIHRTPASDIMPGPEIVASVLDMILNDKSYVIRPHISVECAIIAILLGGIMLAVITFEHFVIGFVVGLMLVLFYGILNLALFVNNSLWLDFTVPLGVLFAGLAASTLYRYYIHDREKNELTHVFSRYVSPQVLKEIVRNPSQAMENLRGEKKELTVLFADLQGFTQQFENADPEMMVQQLNEYLDAMTDVILDHGGTYDKYMGDAVMAFFGAPSELKDHAQMACKAAVEMQNRLHALNRIWETQERKTLAHGIGISSGEMFVGNFGSRNIKNFTVMGNNVNLGARLEAYTRVAAWPIIISAKTWELCATRIKARDLGKIRVKGFTDPIQCYGLEGIFTESRTFLGWQPDDTAEALATAKDG